VPAVQDWLQQSKSNWQLSVLRAQPQSPFTHWSAQHVLGSVHREPSWLHVLASPHVSRVGSQTSTPQQSKSVVQLALKLAQPQLPLTH
jgi:hypothetical protein